MSHWQSIDIVGADICKPKKNIRNDNRQAFTNVLAIKYAHRWFEWIPSYGKSVLYETINEIIEYSYQVPLLGRFCRTNSALIGHVLELILM